MPELLQKAFDFIDHHDDYVIGVMKKLLSVDTTVPENVDYAAFCDVLEPLYKELGFECERVVVPPEKAALIRPRVKGDRINLVATCDTGKPKCSFYAHMDTVPIGNGWTRDPFLS